MAVFEKCRRDGRIVLVAIPYEGFDCDQGVVIGPPVLIDMGLSQDTVDAIRSRLIDLELMVAPDLMGKRGVLKNLLRELGVGKEHVNSLIHSYQIDFY